MELSLQIKKSRNYQINAAFERNINDVFKIQCFASNFFLEAALQNEMRNLIILAMRAVVCSFTAWICFPYGQEPLQTK